MKTKFNGFLTLLMALLVQITFAPENNDTNNRCRIKAVVVKSKADYRMARKIGHLIFREAGFYRLFFLKNQFLHYFSKIFRLLLSP